MHPGERAQALVDLALEVQRDLRVAGGDGQGDPGRAVDERRAADQPERHDVAAEAGIFNLLEVFFEFVGSHGEGDFGRRPGNKVVMRGRRVNRNAGPSPL